MVYEGDAIGMHSVYGSNEMARNFDKVTIQSVTFNETGQLEVVRRVQHLTNIMSYPIQQRPDSVLKDVYEAQDGKIVLMTTLEAKVTPKKIVPEKVEF